MVKAPIKPKRELATKNIRIYPSTLDMLQDASYSEGKTIARIVHEAIYLKRHATKQVST